LRIAFYPAKDQAIYAKLKELDGDRNRDRFGARHVAAVVAKPQCNLHLLHAITRLLLPYQFVQIQLHCGHFVRGPSHLYDVELCFHHDVCFFKGSACALLSRRYE